MKPTAEQFWNSLEEECKRIDSQNLDIKKAKKDDYVRRCEERYIQYRTRFMKDDVKTLDRHKVAAILAIEGVASELITCSNVPNGEVFIGQEKIIFTNALRFILQEFNKIITQKGFSKMTQFLLPDAFSCDTAYIDILCRMQYHIKSWYTSSSSSDGKRGYCNPDEALLWEMDLAEQFYLLEYISIDLFYGHEMAAEIYKSLREKIGIIET